MFVLRGARRRSATATPSGTGLPEDYLLVGVPDGATLNDHVNHRIAVTGVISDPAAPRAARGGQLGGEGLEEVQREGG